jgi:hypothetical protein
MRATILSTMLVASWLLASSCASDSATQRSSGTGGGDARGGNAPITHEPYGSEMKDFDTHAPAEIVWKPGPPSLPAGAQIAVLEGDPAKQGPFVFRLKLPDGYTIPPHMHPRAERVTVIQGTFNIAEGETVDKSPGKAKVMPAGSFGYWPARMHHYAWAGGAGGGETIAQLHGIGPWTIQYLNPEDDPRNAKKTARVSLGAIPADGPGAMPRALPIH